MRMSVILSTLSMMLFAASLEAQDDPLAELAALGSAVAETGPEGGGSIRAKKDADMTRQKRLKDPRNIEAKIEAVKTGRFPAVALRVKVLKPCKDGAAKDIKKDETVVLVPKMKVENKAVSMADPDTSLNAGAYYLQPGDKIAARLTQKKDAVWEAEYIERQ